MGRCGSLVVHARLATVLNQELSEACVMLPYSICNTAINSHIPKVSLVTMYGIKNAVIVLGVS